MFKKLFILFFLLFSFNLSYWYENQWFDKYSENKEKVTFECNKQCFIVLGKKENSDFVEIIWNVKWNWSIWYWFLNWQKIIPAEFYKFWWDENITQKFLFTNLAYYSQLIPDIGVVLIIDWDVKASDITLRKWTIWLFESIENWFSEALKYREYNPRTINFLEWPTWNWKYINEVFFPFIIFILFFAFIWYLFGEWDVRRKFLYFLVWTLAFSWLFFDFFNVTNQIKIYDDVKSVKNIMQNGRVGKQNDLYWFLDFIKTKVPSKEKWFFISPYPFDFEWKYHIYPQVKFDKIDKVKYLFYYNPYWKNAPFNFKDPVYNSWKLLYNSWSYDIEKEIIWKDYAKIYILK